MKYILKKYVTASSALEAIKLDKKTPVQDVWVDEEDKKEEKTSCIGFSVEVEDE